MCGLRARLNFRKILRLTTLYAHRRLVSRCPDYFILMYHRVIDDQDSSTLEPGTWARARTFDDQMRFLKTRCDTVSLPELVQSLHSGLRPSKPTCAITFDDGWRDNLTNAFPVLQKLQIPATIFLVPEYIETGKSPWFAEAWDALLKLPPNSDLHGWPIELQTSLQKLSQEQNPARKCGKVSDCLSAIKRLSPRERQNVVNRLQDIVGLSNSDRWILDWDEVRSMLNSGLVDFGAHTRTHPILTHLTNDELIFEIQGSKTDIEDVIGEKIQSFSYPNGDWNDHVRSVVSSSGYELACSTLQRSCHTSEDCLALPRIGIHEGFSEGITSFSPLIFGLRLGIL